MPSTRAKSYAQARPNAAVPSPGNHQTGGLVGNGNSGCACRALDRNRADRTSMPTRSPSLRRPLHLRRPTTLVPVSPASDLTADSAEEEENRSDDQQDQPDRPEHWDAEDEPDDQQDQPQDDHVAPPGSRGSPAQSAGSLPSRTALQTRLIGRVCRC